MTTATPEPTPEPGTVPDPLLGSPGEAEPLPDGDADHITQTGDDDDDDPNDDDPEDVDDSVADDEGSDGPSTEPVSAPDSPA